MRVPRKKLCSILMRFGFDDGPAAQVITSRRDTAPVHLEGLAERRTHLLDLALIILHPLHVQQRTKVHESPVPAKMPELEPPGAGGALIQTRVSLVGIIALIDESDHSTVPLKTIGSPIVFSCVGLAKGHIWPEWLGKVLPTAAYH